jgi:glycosyltransferase involved in cell wall biosynthesis
MTEPRGRRPRIAYLSYSSGEFDARTFRMARTALEAGYNVVVYARWYQGLPVVEERDGYRIVRVAWDWRLAVPWLRRKARHRVAAAMAKAPTERAARPTGIAEVIEQPMPSMPVPRGIAWQVLRRLVGTRRQWWRRLRLFPLYGMGWAEGLARAAEPADLWHGMWAGSLPALARMRSMFGGRAIYDSRDVYLESRDLAGSGRPGKQLLAWLERRWARSADRVLTVNEAYAGLLAAQLGVPRPAVVLNVPSRWDPPEPPPDLIRATIRIPPETAVVLYQGGLMTGRGIEESMDAILEVPGAVLCLLGFGALRNPLIERAAAAPYAGRVFVLDAVPPEDLLAWTASADVSVMAIQPTTLNHRYTTPQKLFESLAAGVPVVAADLAGMAEIVLAADAGLLCDPTSPASIAAAIRELLAAPPAERSARRTRILAVARERYAWEVEARKLLALYAELVGVPAPVAAARPAVAAGAQPEA